MRTLTRTIVRGIYAQLIELEQAHSDLSDKQKDRIFAARCRIGLVLSEEQGK